MHGNAKYKVGPIIAYEIAKHNLNPDEIAIFLYLYLEQVYSTAKIRMNEFYGERHNFQVTLSGTRL
jgi:hypothetical protein